MLNARLDFNWDGNWDNPGEQISTDTAVSAGSNPLAFIPPGGAAVGATCARFPLDSAGGLSPEGLAADGEVED